MQRFVDKIRIPVRLHLSGGESLEGWLALAPQARFHDGPETLLELLNQAARVLPFLRASDGADLLIPRQAIVSADAGAEVDPDWIAPRSYSYTREERVQVRFEDGRRLEGVLRMELPEDQNRASDFLNGGDDFFPLLVSGAVAILNKDRVGEVRLYEASHLPLETAAGES